MNALDTGIDAQSQIIPGEDPEALERLTTQYYDRFLPQGPEEVALINCAVSSDWLLRRFRRVEAELWNRSVARDVEDQRKWGTKPEKFPMAAAFLNQQKPFDRLQRRISAAERSLRASLETLARLRKMGFEVGPATERPRERADASRILSPANPPQPACPEPPASPSNQTLIQEIGFGPEILPEVGQTPRSARVPLDPPGPEVPTAPPADPLPSASTSPDPAIRDTL